MKQPQATRLVTLLGLGLVQLIGCDGCKPAIEPLPPVLPAPQEGCVVVGVLFDEAGDPVAGVRVTAKPHVTCNAFSEGPPPVVEPSAAVTDAEGRFRITGLGKHWYDLKAVQGDLRGRDSISFEEDRTFFPEHLLWLEAATPETTEFLEGAVVDSARYPVENAVVYLLSIDMDGKIDAETPRWTYTDAIGKFRFDHLGWNRWQGCALFAQAPGYGTSLAEFVAFGTTDTKLILTENSESDGVVKNVPLPVTGDGGATGDGLEPTDRDETASATVKPGPLPPEATEAPGYIQGRVVDADNRLVPDALVRAVHKDGWERGHGDTHTGQDGTFLMECTATGTFHVTAKCGRYFSPRVKTRARRNRPSEVTLELTIVGGFVQGSVRQPDGTAYRGAHVDAKGYKKIDFLNCRVMNPDGTFRLGPVPPGRYTICAHRDYRPASDVYPPKESRHVEVELEPGGYVAGIDLICEGFMQWSNCTSPTGPLSIAGRVTDENGFPMHRAEVALYGEKWGLLRPLVYTDRDGRYAFGRLPECGCHVMVEPPSHLRDGPEARVRNGREAQTGSGDVDLVLRRCVTCSGRIIDSETCGPIREFWVGVAHSRNGIMTRGVLGLDWVFAWTRFTDSEGRFALHGLSPTEPSILGFCAPFRGARFRKLPPPEKSTAVDIEIVLQPGAKLLGRVVDESSRPVAGAYVETLPPSMFQLSDRDGRFELPGVQATRTRVMITNWTFQYKGTAWVTPAAGGTATVEVALKKKQ